MKKTYVVPLSDIAVVWLCDSPVKPDVKTSGALIGGDAPARVINKLYV